MSGPLVSDLVVGAAAGYVGSRVMDLTTTAVYERTSAQARAREVAANPDGTPLTLGRALARATGQEGDRAAYALAGKAHRGLGMTYGAVAALLAGRGVPPVAAGIATGAGAFALVDELALSAVLPPPTAYPVASHVRGALGHLALGATVGLLLAGARRVPD